MYHITLVLTFGQGIPGVLIIETVEATLVVSVIQSSPSQSQCSSQMSVAESWVAAMHFAYCEHTPAQLVRYMDFLEINIEAVDIARVFDILHISFVLHCDWV